MLNLFGSFVVPGVESVTLYHDDEDDELLYMLPCRPSLSRSEDGAPAFSLLVYRDESKPPESQPAGAFLTLSAELSVRDEDQAKIKDYVTGHYRGIRPVYAGPGSISFAPVGPRSQPIRLVYPLWTDGTVNFCRIPAPAGPLVSSQNAASKPSLISTNRAIYQAGLTQAGAMFLQSTAARGRIPGSVNYKVSFSARVPGLTIRISGKASEVYRQLKQSCPTYEARAARYYLYAPMLLGDLHWIQSALPGLNVQVDPGDWRHALTEPSSAQEAERNLSDMASELARNYLTDRFFAACCDGGLASDPVVGADGGSAPAWEDSGDADDSPPGGQMWLKRLTQQELEGELDFLVTAGSGVTLTGTASGVLSEMLTVSEIEQSVIRVDLDAPVFRFLDVPVGVSADFEAYQIAAIKVLLSYNQQDEPAVAPPEGDQLAYSQAFLFTTGREEFRFRGRLATDKNGNPKSTYSYYCEIYFKDSAGAEKTPVREQPNGAVVIDDGQVSHVRVQALWGTVPETVRRAQIHFRYPGVELATAEKDIILSPDHKADTWFTFTGGNPPTEYEYRISFFLADGRRVDLPVRQSTSSELSVNADTGLFAGMASKTSD